MKQTRTLLLLLIVTLTGLQHGAPVHQTRVGEVDFAPDIPRTWDSTALAGFMLPHDGSITTLEELLDPGRLEEGFVPSGFRGADVEARAVPGHPFGLELTDEDWSALIAYLMTL